MQTLLTQLIFDQLITLEDVEMVQRHYDDPQVLKRYPIIHKIQLLRLMKWIKSMNISNHPYKPQIIQYQQPSLSMKSSNPMEALLNRIHEIDCQNVPSQLKHQISKPPINFEAVDQSNVCSIIKDIEHNRQKLFMETNKERKEFANNVNLSKTELYKQVLEEKQFMVEEEKIILNELKEYLPKKYYEMIEI
eukprot:NODE_368_length_8682_cov_0.309915.p5 type:complete len:191 gc:universal NODE_368_length_8682_cov_0.309915:4366-3794(-)